MNFKKYEASYLFMRGIQMLRDRDVEAAREIGTLIDNEDENIRRMAQFFIYRASIDFGKLSAPVFQHAAFATV